jgi:hypothetical protein
VHLHKSVVLGAQNQELVIFCGAKNIITTTSIIITSCFIMKICHLSSWKNHFLQTKDLETPLTNFENSFDDISENPGIGFLSLDPSGTKMQVFHHPTITRGSWTNLSKNLVAIIGFDHDAKPVKIIIKKSVNDIKGKSHSLHELSLGSDSVSDFEKLHSLKVDISLKNIIPILSFY